MSTAITKIGTSPRTNYEGIKIGKLTIINKVPAPAHIKRKGPTYYSASCDCGKKLVISSGNVTKYVSEQNNGSKNVRSCGCYTIRVNVGMKVGNVLLLEKKKVHTSNITNAKGGNRRSRYITYYNCRCDCGKEKLINGSLIWKNICYKRKDQVPLSCGCLLHTDFDDIVGVKIGDFTVDRVLIKNDKAPSRAEYECSCDCGFRIIRKRGGITHNIRHKSSIKCEKCEILRHNIPVGSVFGKLTVTDVCAKKDIKNPKDVQNYICKCECGNTKTFTRLQLIGDMRRKYKKSCGCEVKLQKFLNIKKHNGVPITYLESIKEGAKARELEYTVSDDYVTGLYHKQNKMCALTGKKMWFYCDLENPTRRTNASLDRIDNDKGYIEGNLQWVDTKINMLKLAWGNEEFKQMCSEVTLFNMGKKSKLRKSKNISSDQSGFFDFSGD